MVLSTKQCLKKWGYDMARRRMIDPNFWQSEDVSKLSIRQRLLLIGLFSNADDEGKLRGNPAFVRSLIFPYEDFTLKEIEQDLNDVESIGSIQQYAVEDSKYIRLYNWKKFQRVDKPQSSVIPDPTNIDSENESKNESENDSRLKERKGKELKGEEDKGKEEPKQSHNFLPLINKLNLKCKGIWEMEQLESYLTTMDHELIEEALKRSEHKGSVAYALGILPDWNAKGLKTLEDIKPKAGENGEKHQGQLQHGGNDSKNKSITGDAIGWLPSAARPANYTQLLEVSGH